MVKEWSICAQHFTPRKEPMIPTELLQFPGQKFGIDLFYLKGSNYLIVVDYFSRYPEVQKLSTTTTASIIDALKSVFSRFGVPETVLSDNGPQFTSQLFTDFADAYSFHHVTSSPRFAQSNGQAERTVQTVKKLLVEYRDPHMAMLTYRSTPFPWCKLSPAELLMGRCLRANIPMLTTQLTPNWSFLEKFREQNEVFKQQQKLDYDRSHGVRNLPTIPDNSQVWITSEEQPVTGTVSHRANTPRSYIIKTQSREIRRNRQHLSVVPTPREHSPDSDRQPLRSPVVTRSRSGIVIRPPERLA